MEEYPNPGVPWLGMLLVVAGWLTYGWWFGRACGVRALARSYPDRREAAVVTLRWRMADLNGWVVSGLKLSACQTGLRVKVPRIFVPFDRSFLVPWDDIETPPQADVPFDEVRLIFGSPKVGYLTLERRAWERLSKPFAETLPKGV